MSGEREETGGEDADEWGEGQAHLGRKSQP